MLESVWRWTLRHKESHFLFYFPDSETWQKIEEPTLYAGCNSQCYKYKHGRGRYALNASLYCQTQRQKRKNNTSYNRLQKIISILSVCLTIEAILCVYGRRGKTGLTDWPTHWQLAAAPKQNHSSFLLRGEKICTISSKQEYYTVYLSVNSLP